MTNIIIFATYWNEIEWIKPSLEQLLKIDPLEIIICDGNFDSRYENQSTDGTREIIEKFVKENNDIASMTSAIRTNKLTRGLNFFFNSGRSQDSIYPSRLLKAFQSQFFINEYRVNQALTFAKMINMSKMWKKDRWMMSYDADTFYTDELIDFFQITNEKNDYDFISADEWTFPEDFNFFTDKFERRKHNNMPFKIKKNIAVYPTRHFMVESMFSYKNIGLSNKNANGGIYHHYKFRNDNKRIISGYRLGDRKPPDKSRFKDLKKFDSIYPEIIRNNFKVNNYKNLI